MTPAPLRLRRSSGSLDCDQLSFPLKSVKMIALIILQCLLCMFVDAIIPPDPMITAAAHLEIRDNGANVIGYELDGAICGCLRVFEH